MCCLLFAVRLPVGKLFPGAILSSSGAVFLWEDAAGSCLCACCTDWGLQWSGCGQRQLSVCPSGSLPPPAHATACGEGGRKGLHGFCVLQSFYFFLWGCWIPSVQWEHREVRQKSSRKCQTQQDVSSWWLLSDLQKHKWHKLAFNSFSSYYAASWSLVRQKASVLACPPLHYIFCFSALWEAVMLVPFPWKEEGSFLTAVVTLLTAFTPQLLHQLLVSPHFRGWSCLSLHSLGRTAWRSQKHIELSWSIA